MKSLLKSPEELKTFQNEEKSSKKTAFLMAEKFSGEM
jgi:hypothetical protein